MSNKVITMTPIIWWLINLTIIIKTSSSSPLISIISSTSSSSSSERPNVCSGLQNGANVRDTNNCNSYYKCENDIPIQQNCSADQLFNYITEKCDEPNEVDCFECQTNKLLVDIPVPNQCNQFIRCYKNISTQLTCSNGLYFDRNLKMCNLANHELCPFEVLCPKHNDIPIFIKDRDSCNRCEDGEIFSGVCPSTLHFNPNTNLCDHPENSGCTI